IVAGMKTTGPLGLPASFWPTARRLRRGTEVAHNRLRDRRSAMTRPKVAFVGAGGAARGIAHLGVLKACEELGIRFSMFVGASAGAIVAATYGQNIPLDVLIDSYRLPWRRRHDGPRL